MAAGKIAFVRSRRFRRSRCSILAKGSFFWRVGSVTGRNLASDWSPVRRFRVVSGSAGARDKRPPDLVLERSKVIGNLVMVSGRTDPGALVTVNGEAVDTDKTGAFRKMITMGSDGLSTIVVKSSDGAGNETVRQEKVLIQTN